MHFCAAAPFALVAQGVPSTKIPPLSYTCPMHAEVVDNKATHPASSVVRLYIYNEYSDPFTPPGFGARVIMSPPKAAGTAVRPAAKR